LSIDLTSEAAKSAWPARAAAEASNPRELLSKRCKSPVDARRWTRAFAREREAGLVLEFKESWARRRERQTELGRRGRREKRE
jgi:hypothetical protein